jgi:hypothetical protein
MRSERYPPWNEEPRPRWLRGPGDQQLRWNGLWSWWS